MAEGVLLARGHLAERAAVALDRHDDRVVPEPPGSPRGLGHPSLDLAAHDDLVTVGPDRGGRGHVPAGPLGGGHALERAEHLGDPVAVAGPAGRVDAGGPSERIDLDARVVGQGQLAGGGGQGAGLDESILLEGGAGLLDARILGLDDPAWPEDPLNLRDLVGVPGGQPHPGGARHAFVTRRRGAGGSAIISACRSRISVIPVSARTSISTSSARLNARPSAVPCTSTKRPSDVMTTFMSTSARLSST